jgi:hypothetical protein
MLKNKQSIREKVICKESTYIVKAINKEFTYIVEAINKKSTNATAYREVCGQPIRIKIILFYSTQNE